MHYTVRTSPMSGKRRRRSQGSGSGQSLAPLGPTYCVAAYTVFPTGYEHVEHAGMDQWCLSVVNAGNGWAIRRGDKCLNIALQWEEERRPELCDKEFLRRCRYNEHAALLRARRAVDRLEFGGLTFDEVTAGVRIDRSPPGAPQGGANGAAPE